MSDKYELILGKCEVVMPDMPDESFDSCVTDPPYDLTSIVKRYGKEGSKNRKGSPQNQRLAKGFMGQTWDGSGIAFNVEVWKEVYRVLKPGAYLLAFGGTRTQHRMVCAIEDAGFVIQDQILAWTYSCLDEETECLTKEGWKTYDQLTTESEVLQWDHKTGELSWVRPSIVLVKDYEGPMVRLCNRHTDQKLTPNHRVYARIQRHSRDRYSHKFEVVKAEELKTHWYIDLPMAGVLKEGEKFDSDRAYLVGWWLTDAWPHQDCSAVMFSQCKPETLDKLREALAIYPHSEYYKKAKEPQHNDEYTFYVRGELSSFLRSRFPERKLTWEVLGWDIKARFRLFEGLMDGDGSWGKEKDNSGAFWSKDPERRSVFVALALSLGYRVVDNGEDAVYITFTKFCTQIQRVHRRDHEEYKGKIWCVKVPKEAFVVRRNGNPFITGNTGFPKAANISKSIDKKFFRLWVKAYRPRIGKKRWAIDRLFRATKKDRWATRWFALIIERYGEPEGKKGVYTKEVENRPCQEGGKFGLHNLTEPGTGGYNDPDRDSYALTEPASEEAKLWEGWYTALAPSIEPICVAQKPLVGSYADNALEHGVGGMNIEECRIGVNEITKVLQPQKEPGHIIAQAGRREPTLELKPTGNWPKNLILQHHPECEKIGERKVQKSGWAKTGSDGTKGYQGTDTFKTRKYSPEEIQGRVGSYKVVDVYKCHPDCPCAHMDRQRKGVSELYLNLPYECPLIYIPKPARSEREQDLDDLDTGRIHDGRTKVSDDPRQRGSTERKGIHPTKKPLALMRYLVKLVTPRGGKVLDPFVGSGTTVLAAIKEGIHGTGIEMTEPYFKIAEMCCKAETRRFSLGSRQLSLFEEGE